MFLNTSNLNILRFRNNSKTNELKGYCCLFRLCRGSKKEHLFSKSDRCTGVFHKIALGDFEYPPTDVTHKIIC